MPTADRALLLVAGACSVHLCGADLISPGPRCNDPEVGGICRPSERAAIRPDVEPEARALKGAHGGEIPAHSAFSLLPDDEENATSTSAVEDMDCDDYLKEEGCGWTSRWNCPGQATGGREGVAEDDASIGFKCCCEMEGWKEAPPETEPACERGEAVHSTITCGLAYDGVGEWSPQVCCVPSGGGASGDEQDGSSKGTATKELKRKEVKAQNLGGATLYDGSRHRLGFADLLELASLGGVGLVVLLLWRRFDRAPTHGWTPSAAAE